MYYIARYDVLALNRRYSKLTMEFNFAGKKVLVTGAGKGIGRATAITLAKAGCRVYALSRTKETLDSLVQEYPDIIPITQDLINWDETRHALEKLEVLDGLVNNAGACPYVGPATDCPKDHLDFFMNNNLFSAINCMQVVTKKMIESGKPGSIVNVSSIVAQGAFPQLLAYGTSKAGMDFATKQFALELGPHNIRVNSLNTSSVETDCLLEAEAASGSSIRWTVEERTPLGRINKPEEVVSSILYLLSDASAMVTGTLHFVDGGLNCNITTKQ